MQLQLRLFGEIFLNARNPVPTEHQRKLMTYDHDKVKYDGNLMYGRFLTLGFK